MDQSDQPPGRSSGAGSVFSQPQRQLLRSVLDQLVPPEGALPGAGEPAVCDSIERALAASSALRRAFLDGLTEIELAAGQEGADGFATMTADQQLALLRRIEAERPAFFRALIDQTYRGYYLLPEVHASIGYEARPPQPLGYELPPFDESLLGQQRKRDPFWRRTD